MIINKTALDAAGYNVMDEGNIIRIEPNGMHESSEALANYLFNELELPTIEKEILIDGFINRVNNAKIMLIINNSL